MCNKKRSGSLMLMNAVADNETESAANAIKNFHSGELKSREQK
jgi:hypothetical protein